MIRNHASISFSGPATEALERSFKRRRVLIDKENVKFSFSSAEIFDSVSQASGDESFPVIAWEFDE